MQSLKELYKVGPGPSSSHTLAPYRAIKLALKEFGELSKYRIELFGSLSLTGKGHFTDKVFYDYLAFADVKVYFKIDWDEVFPNGFYLSGYDGENKVFKWTVFSMGGGSIQIKEFPLDFCRSVYHENSFDEIKKVLKNNKISLLDYIYGYESDLKLYLKKIVIAMFDSCERGLNTEGQLLGSLKINRCAKRLLEISDLAAKSSQSRLKIMAYAYAVNEENACNNQVVTTPTLGACGTLAACAYHYYNDLDYSLAKIIDGMAIAGIFGNLIKENATISGAVGGCQAEIGTACSMASAFVAYMQGCELREIEYAAEMGMEHNLGLTCDPVMGYVIIPCIERNSLAALRAFDSASLAQTMSLIKHNKVSFDEVVNTMEYTGSNICHELRETSLGGLAKEVNLDKES